MNLLPSFAAWQFALAGALCAAGPVIIHWLNRRRFRVVNWAAMDFLRAAMKRNRKILQFRDLLLLLLRTLAVLLFGLALARPFFSAGASQFDAEQPVHAILVFDNSLSMGYISLEGSLLERAKLRGRELIDRLPRGSRISIIPWCGSRQLLSATPYQSRAHAREALESLELVDRTARIPLAANRIREAAAALPDLPPRVVLFTDQQQLNWRDVRTAEEFAELPAMQVVHLPPDRSENSWIAGIHVQDGLADVQTPTTIVVRLQYEGDVRRENVPLRLAIDGRTVASRTLTLEPAAGVRDVTFEHVFRDVEAQPGEAVPVVIAAELEPDRLPADDRFELVTHVVSALPVVFIDAIGAEDEDALRSQLGETRPLRRLLAPGQTDRARQLITVRHVTPEQLTRDTLADARLAVLAGVPAPTRRLVDLLRDYVSQGGQLLLAAGGRGETLFQTDAWNSVGWNQGQGILPTPLLPGTIGNLPSETETELKPFTLSFESLRNHQYFQLAGVAEDDLRELYAEPFFFRAVHADVRPATLEAIREAERQRLDQQWQTLAEIDQRAITDPSGADQQRRALRPNWLLWGEPLVEPDAATDPQVRAEALEEAARRGVPRVLALYDLGQLPLAGQPAGGSANSAGASGDSASRAAPFLVERRIGAGKVVLVTTGLLPGWNTLAQTNTFLIFDRILRDLIQQTLPQRNYGPQPQLAVPLPTQDRQIQVKLLRPSWMGSDDPANWAEESLDAGFIGRDQLGVQIENPLTRGVYRVEGYRGAVDSAGSRSEPAADSQPGAGSEPAAAGGRAGAAAASESDEEPAAQRPLWTIPLAISNSPEESELTPLARGEFEQLAAASDVQWVGEQETISLVGSRIRGQNSWWYLVIGVLVVLLSELGILAYQGT